MTQNLDRFKMRWFDNSSKMMAQIISLNLEDDYAIVRYDYADEFTPNEEVKLSDGFLMQCIGIKSTDGKLIFEGDVVRITYFVSDTPLPVEIYAKVIYYKNVFGFNTILNRDVFIPITDFVHDYYKVIGNIYENPKLGECEADMQLIQDAIEMQDAIKVLDKVMKPKMKSLSNEFAELKYDGQEFDDFKYRVKL